MNTCRVACCAWIKPACLIFGCHAHSPSLKWTPFRISERESSTSEKSARWLCNWRRIRRRSEFHDPLRSLKLALSPSKGELQSPPDDLPRALHRAPAISGAALQGWSATPPLRGRARASASAGGHEPRPCYADLFNEDPNRR